MIIHGSVYAICKAGAEEDSDTKVAAWAVHGGQGVSAHACWSLPCCASARCLCDVAQHGRDVRSGAAMLCHVNGNTRRQCGAAHEVATPAAFGVLPVTETMLCLFDNMKRSQQQQTAVAYRDDEEAHDTALAPLDSHAGIAWGDAARHGCCQLQCAPDLLQVMR